MKHLGENIRLEAHLIIRADGVKSKVERWAGMYGALKPGGLEICAQLLIQCAKLGSDHCHPHGKRIYAWRLWLVPAQRPQPGQCGHLCALGSPSSAGLALRLPEAFAKLLPPDGKALELVAG